MIVLGAVNYYALLLIVRGIGLLLVEAYLSDPDGHIGRGHLCIRTQFLGTHLEI